MLSEIELYQVKVRGAEKQWAGLFIEMPDSQQIEEALCLDIAKLDPDIEHEFDQAVALRPLLEILPLYVGEDDVRVAGVLIGSVTIESIPGFAPVPLVKAELPIHEPMTCRDSHLDGTGMPKQSVIDGSFA